MNKNLRNSILFRSENKLKLYQEGKKLSVTRSAVAVNPLTCYNVSTGNVMEQFANNALVKHGDYGFIGGDTLEVTFDMGTKVAGSVVECPCKWYFQNVNLATIPNPTTGWGEYDVQSVIDKIKNQDGTYQTFASSLSGFANAMMLELDLTPLCNQLYGGSNAALKAALKSIQADIWAMGSGSNASVLTNGVKVQMWNGTAWEEFNSSTSGSIIKIPVSTTNPNKIQSTNKVYTLIHATYPSDGTIPSSVSLDYAKITIQLNRTVDVVAPKSVYLPKYWAMVGSFSPSKLRTEMTTNHTMFYLVQGLNVYMMFWRSGTDTIVFRHLYNSVSTDVTINYAVSTKYKILRFVVQRTSSGLKFSLLDNNGVTLTGSTADANLQSGQHSLYVFQNTSLLEQAYSFTDLELLYDLQSLGKPNGLTDAEAEVILRGIQYPSTSEMVVNGDFTQGSTGWALHANASVSGGILTLNATAGYQSSSQLVNVLPNQNYKLSFNKTGIYGHIAYGYLTSADVQIGGWNYIGNGTDNNCYETSPTTPSNCAKIKLVCENSQSGTFTFDSISLKYVKPSGQLITAPNKELFDINSVSLHANAVRSGNSIVLNATSPWNVSDCYIPVLPNNKYEMTGTVIGNGGVAHAHEFYNSYTIKNNYSTLNNVTFKTVITTQANTNRLRIVFESDRVGTFTFSNVSIKLKQ